MDALLSSLDSVAGLVVLALLAFGDTLIGVGFFVFGELAFLAAGAAFAANGALIPGIVVLVAAWAGDVTSYLIGERYGARISLPFLKRLKRRKAWRRARSELARRGAVFVVISRFLGPVAWVTPFLAGTLGMRRRQFLLAAALGVILGAGQFLVYGAIGARVMDALLPFVLDHHAVFLLLICMILSSLYVWRRSERGVVLRGLQVLAIAAAIFLASNLTYFFVFNSHAAQGAPRMTYDSVCDAAAGPFTVDPGSTDLHLPQPVNVILLSDGTGADLMAALGWHRNVTFTHDEIGFVTYLGLVLQSTPPVSELYLRGVPADSAHQMSGTLKVREHIRWWQMGAGVHLGAISKTEEIAIKYYSHLPVLLHDIDPKVDLSRALLADQVADLPGYRVLGLAALTLPVSDGIVADYETDGDILVLAKEGYVLPPDLADCLGLRPSL
ncbi:LssY C-terminal domain-containing protein [Dinoroseobacter sp. S76]|uniref:LssY C-terminal domain-containing protein n=1 Tax=Dinoroseobacter sp. S76 TaxID=3415124 RepID=UPI003C7BCF9A